MCMLVEHETNNLGTCPWKHGSAAALVAKNSTIASAACGRVSIMQFAQDKAFRWLLLAAFWNRNAERDLLCERSALLKISFLLAQQRRSAVCELWGIIVSSLCRNNTDALCILSNMPIWKEALSVFWITFLFALWIIGWKRSRLVIFYNIAQLLSNFSTIFITQWVACYLIILQ